MLYLLQTQQGATDTWTRRAIKNSTANLAALRNPITYRSPDRYSRAVRDVNRVLEAAAAPYGAVLGLADYQHEQWSPVSSADLMRSAEHPERNPFYPWFSMRLLEMLKGSVFSQKHTPDKGTQNSNNSRGETAGKIVGMSLNYLSQALTAFAMLGFLRREYPGATIVLGGGLVTSWMKRPGWKNPFGDLVDHLIAGPGEGPLLDLIGVKAAQGGHYAPDYQSLPLQDYLAPGFILPYSASSGCYWNKCSFCPETAEQNPYIPVPIEAAIAELSLLVEKTRPVMIHFLDNAVSPALMRSLANKPLGVPWYGFARISKDLTDIDYCMALKRSGCTMLKLGLESGDQGVLDRLQKGIDLETASSVLKNLKQAGIAAYVYLLFGTPEETLAEARSTLAFVLNHHDKIAYLNLSIFNMPLCGPEAEGHAVEQFYDGDLSLYTGFKHPHGWDRKQVRSFLEKEFKKHKIVSAILKHDPPYFTSNHAAFFS